MLLTALGVGLGVMLLLLASTAPTVRDAMQDRMGARSPVFLEEGEEAGGDALLASYELTGFRGTMVSGLLLEPLGDPEAAVRPPGIDRIPTAGELYVSPALRDLLRSEDGALLAERFDEASIVGVIGAEGLSGPHELHFYLGTDTLSKEPAPSAVSSFGEDRSNSGMDPVFVMLIVVIIVVLLLPIGVFVLTAVRFGGESRDRRLSALRLMGADNGMTRRIAAGESLVGALLGLLVGACLFLVARMFVGEVPLPYGGVSPADTVPAPLIAASIVVLVPACAVLVTLFALRKVAVSPLGVSREGTDRGRRLWWRLVLPAVGIAILAVLGGGSASAADEWAIVTGVLMTLTGFTLLLPWIVEVVVARLRGGPLSWQLATRRLQLNSGPAARTVSGITIAVAGAIALQMLFSAVDEADREATGQGPSQVQLVASSSVDSSAEGLAFARGIDGAEGVASSFSILRADLPLVGAEPDSSGRQERRSVVVADCAALDKLITFSSCADGDAFVAGADGDGDSFADRGDASVVRPGDRLDLDNAYPGTGVTDPRPWDVPRVEQAGTREFTVGETYEGLFVTPSAFPVEELSDIRSTVLITLDPRVPDAAEHVRNHIGIGDPGLTLHALSPDANSTEMAAVGDALRAAAIVTMAVIGASMVVSTIEQLRDRKRQLSVLVAFGTDRSTLGASVLWQTAIPVVIGLVIATGCGLGLGLLLLRMAGLPVTDWLSFVPLVGAGLAMVVLVTLASLPSLWQMMRPDGLRTE
ncbi:ABC transporter permease [Nocardiopsis ansamitocini]|nr:FtsX-like permease family protein [Nocardiopsis ansamitocini]